MERVEISNIKEIQGIITGYNVDSNNTKINIFTKNCNYILNYSITNEKSLISKMEVDLEELCYLKKSLKSEKKLFKKGFWIVTSYNVLIIMLSIIFQAYWLLAFCAFGIILDINLIGILNNIRKNIKSNDNNFDKLIDLLEFKTIDMDARILELESKENKIDQLEIGKPENNIDDSLIEKDSVLRKKLTLR